MNKSGMWIIAMLLAVQIVAAATQQSAASGFSTSYGDVYVTQLSYDPFPASPGTYIDVWYRVENRGDATLDGVQFVLQPEFPFSLDGGDTIRAIGTLTPRQAAVVKFRVRVSEDALQGDHPLKYTWRSAQYPDNSLLSSIISVRSTDALLVVSTVAAEPEQIEPGMTSKVTLSFTNVGDAFIRYVTVRIGLFKEDAGEELPFSPAGSGTSAGIVNIAPGESQSVSFTLAADPDAKGKPYSIPVFITYVDSAGRNITRKEQVGVRVGSEPKLLVYVDQSDVHDSSAPGDVVIRFVNAGSSDIKFLRTTLQQTDDFLLLSAPTQYVGAIDSDDYETVTYSLRLTEDARNVALPLVVAYQDANNKQYSEGMTVSLVVHSKQELGISSNNTMPLVIAVIVIGIVGFFIYRRVRAKRHVRKG